MNHGSITGALALSIIALAVAALPALADPQAAVSGNPGPQAGGDSPKPPVATLAQALQALKLPGVVINPERRCVDIEASICLNQGALELIACTKDTKEHESIIVVAARPLHIHTALLLIGARNGNPAMRRAINEEQTRWVDLPPRGDLIEVLLEFKDSEGKLVERPISDFITRGDEYGDVPGASPRPDAPDAPAARFPDTFIFAGSQLLGDGKTPRQYLAELSGNVISIATFGDELLCLPDVQSHENGALMWQVDSTHLPAVGSKITLRLRLKKPPEIGPTP